MLCTRQGSFVLVAVSPADVNDFNRHFPCSNILNDSAVLFEFDTRNGDLVNVTVHLEDGQYVDSEVFDGSALVALSNDASNFAVNAGQLPQWAKR